MGSDLCASHDMCVLPDHIFYIQKVAKFGKHQFFSAKFVEPSKSRKRVPTSVEIKGYVYCETTFGATVRKSEQRTLLAGFAESR